MATIKISVLAFLTHPSEHMGSWYLFRNMKNVAHANGGPHSPLARYIKYNQFIFCLFSITTTTRTKGSCQNTKKQEIIWYLTKHPYRFLFLSVGHSVSWLVGWSVSWLVGQSVGRSVGWSVSQLVGQSVSWLVSQSFLGKYSGQLPWHLWYFRHVACC